MSENDLFVTEEERTAVERLATEVGDSKAAKQLGLSLDSLLRVLARRDIRNGTVLMLRQALKKSQEVPGLFARVSKHE